MRGEDDDALHTLVVWSALAVLALVLWLGGRRLYHGWSAGRGQAAVTAPVRPPDDGVDRPPPSIPPLALAGVKAAPKKPPRKAPAAVAMPPITPDRQ